MSFELAPNNDLNYDELSLVSKDRYLVNETRGDLSMISNVAPMDCVEANPHKRPKSKGANASKKLREKISLLQQEAKKYEISSDEKSDIMDEEYNENIKLINNLKTCLAERVVGENMAKLTNHWEYKATRLSIKCLAFKEDVKKQDEAIQDLEDWKMIQEERIASMQQEPIEILETEEERVHESIYLKVVESISLKGGRPFAYRASLDPSFKASLERAARTTKKMNDQIREEAKIEVLALEECLAIADSEKVELRKEIVLMKAILRSTYGRKTKRKRLFYELSCRKCNKRAKFPGKTTEQDLRATVQKHFDKVVNKTAKKPKDNSNAPPIVSWGLKFAQHFAMHWKTPKLSVLSRMKAVPKKGILEFCHENVKVEVLQKQAGSHLYWEEWSEKIFSDEVCE